MIWIYFFIFRMYLVCTTLGFCSLIDEICLGGMKNWNKIASTEELTVHTVHSHRTLTVHSVQKSAKAEEQYC